MSNIVAIILAAGKGTRMPSAKPKALQNLLGESMISYVYRALEKSGADIWTVVGHGADEVRAHIRQNFGEVAHEKCVMQEKQLGTGHAVQCALKAIQEADQKNTYLNAKTKIFIVNADMPLLTQEVVQEFMLEAQHIPVAFMSLELEEPGSYGRVMRTNFDDNAKAVLKQNSDCSANDSARTEILKTINTGTVKCIIEAKDFNKKYSSCEIFEVNAGVYVIDYGVLEEFLPRLSRMNESGELYLTDIIELANENGIAVDAISTTGASTALLGVNTPQELYTSEKDLHQREIQRRMLEGVVIHAPESVRISPIATVEAGAEIFGPCEIYGASHIGAFTSVESHCYIKNTTLGEACTIRSFCHLEDATVGDKATLGPYARLRPKTELAENVRVGNFVEIKKSYVGRASKVNHLSYIGDSHIGEEVNVGAGCITCNYDGKHKHQTTIGDRSFLGSNCCFVAPVTLGKNVLTGAGSVITEDVPDGQLAVARAKQIVRKKSKKHE